MVFHILNILNTFQSLIKCCIVLHGPSGPSPTSQYEHSSIPATVKKIFNLPEFLTKRDAWAGTFEGLLTRSSPRTDCPGQISIFCLSFLSLLSLIVVLRVSNVYLPIH